jgi:HlyD family secretion protein
MKAMKIIGLVGGIAGFLGLFLWLVTTRGPLAPLNVESVKVTQTTLKPSVFGVGVVEANLSYAVGPVAPGRVLRVLVDVGETVKAGQLLAEMDPMDLDQRVQASQSSTSRSRKAVDGAAAQVAEAESRVKFIRANHERDQKLFDQKVLSKQMLDNSANELERAEASLASARAAAAVARQDVGRISAESQGVGTLRDSLRLVSPVDGVIVSRDAEPGTTVVAGQAILRLIVPESLWVSARIDQSRAHGVSVGQQADIVLRSRPDVKLPARVARIEMQSDPVTEERIVNVSFEPQPEDLYMGELAEVTIYLPEVPNVLTIPSAAVARQAGKTGVWQSVDGVAQFTPVEIGSQGQAGVVQILNGLNEGDKVIVHSSAQLKDDIRVREKGEQP